MLRTFFEQADGQDIVEYTLLLSFVVLISAALFSLSGSSVSTIWTVANNDLSRAMSTVGI